MCHVWLKDAIQAHYILSSFRPPVRRSWREHSTPKRQDFCKPKIFVTRRFLFVIVSVVVLLETRKPRKRQPVPQSLTVICCTIEQKVSADKNTGAKSRAARRSCPCPSRLVQPRQSSSSEGRSGHGPSMCVLTSERPLRSTARGSKASQALSCFFRDTWDFFYVLLNRNQRNVFCTYFFCNKLVPFKK